MAETKTKDQTQGAPPVASPAQPVANLKRKEAWETFRDELNQRAEDIGSQLPPNLSRERFLGAALAAVKATPDILRATPRSLMSALTKAAQDGLLPDGREGIITVFNTTIDGHKEAIAQWNPMFYGIRKRARELDGIIIDAQVVFAGDEFDYELGDAPFIKHKPKPRIEAMDAGSGVAVYAIFRHPEQGILHREVMWKPEVFAVMNQSRAKNSLMWTVFWTEGWKKTAGRRGSKSVPVSPQLERLITRDDENFDFPRGGGTPMLEQRPTPPEPPEPPEPKSKTIEPDPAQPDQKGGGDEPGAKADAAADFVPEGEITPEVQRSLDQIKASLAACNSEEGVESTFDSFDVQAGFAGNTLAIGKAFGLKDARLAEIANDGQGALFGDDDERLP